MDQWGVFSVISALVIFGVSIGAPLLKLNSNITRLNTVLDMLQKQFDKSTIDNEKEHIAIWDRCDEHDKTVNDHETRITVLEKKEA